MRGCTKKLKYLTTIISFKANSFPSLLSGLLFIFFEQEIYRIVNIFKLFVVFGFDFSEFIG